MIMKNKVSFSLLGLWLLFMKVISLNVDGWVKNKRVAMKNLLWGRDVYFGYLETNWDLWALIYEEYLEF